MKHSHNAKQKDVDPSLIDEAIARQDYIVVHTSVGVTPAGLLEFPLNVIAQHVGVFGRETARALSVAKCVDIDSRIVLRAKYLLLVYVPNAPRNQLELLPRPLDDLTETVWDGLATTAKALESEREAVVKKKKYVPNKKTQRTEEIFRGSLKLLATTKGDCEAKLPSGQPLSKCLSNLQHEAFKPLVQTVNANLPLVGILRSHDELTRVARLQLTEGQREDQILRITWNEDDAFTAALKRCYCDTVKILLYVEHQKNVLGHGGAREAFRAVRLETDREEVTCATPRGDLIDQAESMARQAA
jgi:hypothetical protein